MQITIHLVHNNQDIQVTKGIALAELADMVQPDFSGQVVLCFLNGKLKELHKKLNKDCTIEFIDTTHKDGFRTYQRSLTFLFIKAVKQVYRAFNRKEVDVKVHFTINRGFYCEILNAGSKKVDSETVKLIRARMQELVKLDLKINKRTVATAKAIKIFGEQNMQDKVELLKYRSASNTNIYELDGFYDYFYGFLVPSTKHLKVFEIYPFADGIMLQHAERQRPEQIAGFNPDMKLYQTQIQTAKWADLMEVTTIGELNNLISRGKMNELVLVAEALMEKNIAQVADQIIENIDTKKFVFIAGPSSSGKTTFSHRLGIQLQAYGLNPQVISIDNYFVNREDTPKDEDGNYNFEILEAIDIPQFNTDMMKLLDRQTVDIPFFNFVSGKREYKDNYLTLGERGILILEGIHGLNNGLSYQIPEQNKFKIYISSLTQLNIDNHNRIPSTDGRLLRRIVRDYNYRGASAHKTISMWPSVRAGEDSHIFPFQEQSDVMFNSALLYELAVLKQYALPLLYSVPQDSDEFLEAKRLIKFLDYLLGISSEFIPSNSLLREFIGGSNFRH